MFLHTPNTLYLLRNQFETFKIIVLEYFKSQRKTSNVEKHLIDWSINNSDVEQGLDKNEKSIKKLKDE